MNDKTIVEFQKLDLQVEDGEMIAKIDGQGYKSVEAKDILEWFIKMNESEWRIWSIEHGMWWKENRSGYTHEKDKAGKYNYKEALEIIEIANVNNFDTPNESMIKVN